MVLPSIAAFPLLNTRLSAKGVERRAQDSNAVPDANRSFDFLRIGHLPMSDKFGSEAVTKRNSHLEIP
jgi:hypothetical protein